jgi:pSer/pThr/pTyr-binding forkhead associated (FHA) protein
MWRIIITGPGFMGTPLNLPDKGPVRIGRGEQNEIVLRGDGVSRQHAALHCSGNKYEITDINSRNGTFVNGTNIGNEVRRLFSGDNIAIGDYVLKIEHPFEVDVPTEIDVDADDERPPEQFVTIMASKIGTNPFVNKTAKSARDICCSCTSWPNGWRSPPTWKTS